MIDYPPIDCSGFSTLDLSEQLLSLCDDEKIKDKIVRINLKNVSRAVFKGLDQSYKARWDSSALFLKIKVEYSDDKNKNEIQLDSTRLDESFSNFIQDELKRIKYAMKWRKRLLLMEKM